MAVRVVVAPVVEMKGNHVNIEAKEEKYQTSCNMSSYLEGRIANKNH